MSGVPSRARTSKKNDRERQALAHRADVELASEPPHGDLERLRPAVGAQRDGLAVEDRLAHGQRPATASTISGTAAVTSLRRRLNTRTSAPALCDLHAGAIELVFERGATERAERVGEILGGLRQHRLDRPEELRWRSAPAPTRPRRARPAPPRRRRRPSSRRAARRRPGARSPWRSPRSSALPGHPGAARRAAGAPGNPARRRWRGRTAPASSRARSAPVPLPRTCEQPVERGIELGEGERRRRRRRHLPRLAQGGVADPDLALSRRAREQADRGLRPIGRSARQTAREQLDLGAADRRSRRRAARSRRSRATRIPALRAVDRRTAAAP